MYIYSNSLPLPSLTFYVSPPRSFARFCDTRISSKHINLQKYCPQLARLFEAGQCVQNIKIETKAINIIILSRGLIQLSG